MAEHDARHGASSPAPKFRAARSRGRFPPFDSTHFASQLIWLVITFGLLYYLMSKIALPRVAGILERSRRDKISGDLGAQRPQDQPPKPPAEHEKTLADAKAKAQAVGQEAHQQLAAEADAKRKALEAELNAKLAAAEAQIADTSRRHGQCRWHRQDAAAAIVEQITGKPPISTPIAAALAAAGEPEECHHGRRIFRRPWLRPLLVGARLSRACTIRLAGALDGRIAKMKDELAEAERLRAEARRCSPRFVAKRRKRKRGRRDHRPGQWKPKPSPRKPRALEEYRRPSHQAGAGQDPQAEAQATSRSARRRRRRRHQGAETVLKSRPGRRRDRFRRAGHPSSRRW